MSRTSGALASSGVVVAAVLSGLALAAAPGCSRQCTSQFDCGDQSYCTGGSDEAGVCQTDCFSNEDCTDPFTAPASGFYGGVCTAAGRCVGGGEPFVRGETTPGNPDEIPPFIEGFDDEPGTGRAFIINTISIADESQGFNVDNQPCTKGTTDCIDNTLARLGPLANNEIASGLLSGESLLLMELVGLDEGYRGHDKILTVKMYSARDADEPFSPSNNFRTPPGYLECCEFNISPSSLRGNPRQAKARSPAKIDHGRMRSLIPVPMKFTLSVGAAPHPEIEIERAQLTARVPVSLNSIGDGLLGGALPIKTLAQTENPYCSTVSSRCPQGGLNGQSTLMDLVTAFGMAPDVDLDFDGLECVRDTDGTGFVDLCCDGSSSDLASCAVGSTTCVNGGQPVMATAPGDLTSCVKSPKMADGFSVALNFTAVKAKIVGVGR